MKYPHGTTMWHRGQTEEHLHGFATVQARDAYERGDLGPFERVLRDPAAPPVADEVRIVRAYLGGHLKETIDHLNEMTWIDQPPIAQVAVEELTGDPVHDLQVFLRAIDEANDDA